MTEYRVLQGEDVDGVGTVLKKDGSPLDMSAAVKVYLVLYNGYGDVLAKFMSGVPSGDWYPLDTTDAATGVLAFKVLSEVTAAADPARVYYEVRVRWNSAAHTDDNLFDLGEEKYLFTVVESQVNKLVLP